MNEYKLQAEGAGHDPEQPGLKVTPYCLNTLAKQAHKTAVEKGWWDDANHKTVLECLMLVVTEVAEAAECVRERQIQQEYKYINSSTMALVPVRTREGGGLEYPAYIGPNGPSDTWLPLTKAAAKRLGYEVKPEGLPSELADIIIRVLDLAASLGIDIDAAVIEKMEYNETRPFKHGGKTA